MEACKRALRGRTAHVIIAAVLSVSVALIILLQRDFEHRIYYVNALTAGGAVTVLVGALLLVAFYGEFDIFGYAFRRPSARRQTDYYTYRQQKKEKRSLKPVLSYFVVGAVFIAAGLLLRIGL